MDRLDVLDKHRTLLASSFGHGIMLDLRLEPAADWLPAGFRIPIVLNPADKKALEDGAVFYDGVLEYDDNAKLVIFIALNEPASMRWKDVIPALTALIDEVEGLLKRLAPLA